jgi:hypothetical protein
MMIHIAFDEVKNLELEDDCILKEDFAIELEAGDRLRQHITQHGDKAIYVLEVIFHAGLRGRGRL